MKNNYESKSNLKGLNRALIKRFELLPNVSDFYTEKYGINEYAAIYGIEKVLRRTYHEKLVKAGPNKYLERQYIRLSRYVQDHEMKKFLDLSRIILRKSVSYRLLALNRVEPTWFTMNLNKLRRIWRRLSFICRNESTALIYKRKWIDKKEPGDYGRPLSIPTVEWRSYAFMQMDHIERALKGAGHIAPWQHGGRSGVGVLSCYKQLIPMLSSRKNIFEFDIKGFFDRISHNQIIWAMTRILGESYKLEWIKGMLKARPTTYELPPIKDDKAVRNLEIARKTESLMESFGLGKPLDRISYAQLTGRSPKLTQPPGMEFDPLKLNYTKPRLKEVYKLAMDNIISSTDIRFMGDEQERALGRDRWKNLGQEGKGLPQGLNTSPLLSTIMTDIVLAKLGQKGDLIMYMDDGIIFGETRDELAKNIIELKVQLGTLGLEMEPTKSKLVKTNGKWVDSIRFLGLRYDPVEDTFWSETRSGTKIKFPSKGKWPDIKELAEVNNMNVSQMRRKFDRLINTKSYEAGLKHGFLGCLIAESQYKEAKSLIERKEEIREGQARSWAEITGSKGGFIWKYQDLYHHTECLTNTSSIACARFAEFHRRGNKFYIKSVGRRLWRRG